MSSLTTFTPTTYSDKSALSDWQLVHQVRHLTEQRAFSREAVALQAPVLDGPLDVQWFGYHANIHQNMASAQGSLSAPIFFVNNSSASIVFTGTGSAPIVWLSGAGLGSTSSPSTSVNLGVLANPWHDEGSFHEWMRLHGLAHASVDRSFGITG